MKKILLFLVFLAFFALIVACGDRRESKETTDAPQVAEEVKKPGAEFTVVENEESGHVEEEDEGSVSLAQSTNSTDNLDVYAYRCVNKDNATCSNHIQVPLFATISLTLSDVDVGGVKLAQLPINITFMINDRGLERIIKEISAIGKNGTLTITKEAIWKKYGHTKSEKGIRALLRDKNLAYIYKLSKSGWEDLLKKLEADMKDSPIVIMGVSGNLDNTTIKAPILVVKG